MSGTLSTNPKPISGDTFQKFFVLFTLKRTLPYASRMYVPTTSNASAPTGNIPTTEGPSVACHQTTTSRLFRSGIVPPHPDLELESQIPFSLPSTRANLVIFLSTPSPPTRKAACLNPSKPFLNDTQLYPTLRISSTAKNRMDPSLRRVSCN